MSEKIKLPDAIHHSHQFQQQDLGDTIFLLKGEGPGGRKTLGTILNAESFGFPPQTEEIEAAAIAFADKVVKSYNCHDALVEVLQKAEQLLLKIGDPWNGDDWQTMQDIRAAIAKAKGGADATS